VPEARERRSGLRQSLEVSELANAEPNFIRALLSVSLLDAQHQIKEIRISYPICGFLL
jgi:hypothetical protein